MLLTQPASIPKRISSLARSPIFIVGVFVFITLLLLIQHALWRDEFNPWLIVRDSESWIALWQKVRYEGHPILWYISLSSLYQLTQNFLSMQLFHWGLGVGAIVLLWQYSPFRKLEKILITFGYFPFYEYLIISRNYVLGFFFACLFCVFFPKRQYYYWPLAIILGLLANSHAYGLLMAVFLALMLVLEFVFDRTQRCAYLANHLRRWDLALSLVTVVSSFALAIYCISPPADSRLHGGQEFLFGFDLHRLFVAIGKISGAYFHLIPNSSRWIDLVVTDLFILGVLIVINLKLWQMPWVLVFFNLATLSMTVVMFYLKPLEAPRHMGGLFITLLTSLWLAHYHPDGEAFADQNRPFSLPPRTQKFVNRLFRKLFILFLLVHVIAGIAAIIERELLQPYSASRVTANYMIEQGLKDEFILASRDAQMAPIAGYLKRQLFYPERQSYGSFTLFQDERVSVTQQETLRQAITILEGKNEAVEEQPAKIILVLNKELDTSLTTSQETTLSIQFLSQFVRAYTNEQYYLYQLSLA